MNLQDGVAVTAVFDEVEVVTALVVVVSSVPPVADVVVSVDAVVVVAVFLVAVVVVAFVLVACMSWSKMDVWSPLAGPGGALHVLYLLTGFCSRCSVEVAKGCGLVWCACWQASGNPAHVAGRDEPV